MRISYAQRMMFLFVLVLFVPTNLFAATWNGSVAGTFTDEDIAIEGNVTFTGNVTVTAMNSDVLIVPNGDYFITHANAETFTLQTSMSRTVTFDLSAHDLTFKGATQVFEIFIQELAGQGAGTVVFKLGGGHTLSFKEGSPGTKVYLVMSPANPTIQFIRVAPDNQNVFINIGQDSLLTYVDDSQLGAGGAGDTGTIKFDPTTNSTGRMVLNIANTGGMIIASHLYDGTTVFPNIPGAGQPVFEVENINDVVDANAGLMVVNGNQTLFDLAIDPWCIGTYSGIQYGFVLGNNALLEVEENTYFDYVGTATNQCPDPTIRCFAATPASSYVKSRNPSAFFVDGISTTSNPAAVPAQINFEECAGIFFRSGVNKDGVVESPLDMFYSDTTFTVFPPNKTSGAGNLVFDVEGRLEVVGQNALSAKMEVLSLSVNPTGGNLLSSGYSSCPLVFPLRNFSTDPLGNYLAYNSAYFLLNNTMSLHNTTLVHTDQNHSVTEKNDTTSEPTYVGGESFTFNTLFTKPTVIFDNAKLFVQENIAFTGLDLRITNSGCNANTSEFVFFQNGYNIDDGTGRQMILGTCIGADSCDGCSIICKDAQLDVMQSMTCQTCLVRFGFDLTNGLVLVLTTSTNDATIVEDIALSCTEVPLACQLSVHTIYLGHSSNISIGKQQVGSVPALTGCPLATLDIAGNFFSFETRGGTQNSPENSNITGQGGIFVDNLGLLTIEPTARANISTMVTKSGSGDVYLPKNQVYFHNRIGIADWWNNPALVNADQCLSDYTINWMALKKGYCDFIPYMPCTYNSCPTNCPAVQHVNIDSIPTIQGSVEQLQIKASRIGDPAHIKVDGGYVRELVFLTGCHSAEAPTAVVVLQNEGRIGLGNANTNLDSTQTSGLLGINGITIVANGNGTVEVNSDLVINNVCHILKGPGITGTDFAQTVTLTFHSNCCRSIIVKTGAVLDLSSFDHFDKVILTGAVQLIFEPYSRLILPNKTPAGTERFGLVFQDTTGFRVKAPVEKNFPCQNLLGCPEPEPVVMGMKSKVKRSLYRQGTCGGDLGEVKFHGFGTILLQDDSFGIVEKNAVASFETWPVANIFMSNHLVELQDNGNISIFGVYQIGDKVIGGGAINHILRLNGPNTYFGVKAGAGLLLANRISEFADVSGDWLHCTGYDVQAIALECDSGKFDHSRAYDSRHPYSSKIVIGSYFGSGLQAPLYGITAGRNPDEDPNTDAQTTTNLTPAQFMGAGNVHYVNGFITNETLKVEDTDYLTATNGATIMKSWAHGIYESSPTVLTGEQLFSRIRTLPGCKCNCKVNVALSETERNTTHVAYVVSLPAAVDNYIMRSGTTVSTVAGNVYTPTVTLFQSVDSDNVSSFNQAHSNYGASYATLNANTGRFITAWAILDSNQ